ncbi:ADP-ribosylation factor(Arf)/Arf-like (Arl) small GTPase [Giardia duodenalis]|uniref:ARF3 n=2 Tax=Giardia intestinalis TaxID=5741 RepID=C6LU29_GIAIB|nr:ARF3 [Giardia intestinalis ATCC 50581]ESU44847.1 ADP-ribosylation factor(Arf)/Arf-like (Arl) small GTPase [Giardia intestinalis]
MGIALSRLIQSLFGSRQARVVMVGLDAAGKTTILHQMAYGMTVETIPTMGFTLQTVKKGKLELDVWDIGGQSEFRNIWVHYYVDKHAAIFVVDAADHSKARMEEARIALEGVLTAPELAGVPVLVLANKQDIDGAMSGDTVANMLNLQNVKDHEIKVVETVGTTGKGLDDALKWLSAAVERYWKKSAE